MHNSNIVRRHPDPALLAQLPTYALYGEVGHSLGIDWLHCESIADRSRLHEWEIRPHRHDTLFQILYVQRGRARVHGEGCSLALRGPAVVTVPALTAHGFGFSPRVQGMVFTVMEAHLRELLAHEPALPGRLLRWRCAALPPPLAQQVRQAAAALRDEHAGTARWRTLAIDAALLRLVVLLARGLPDDAGASPPLGRAAEHVQRFRALVERRFREQPALAGCARELGITPTQLNRVCRQVLGRSALAVMHARLLLEAQRELAYTTLSIKQIALGLGFADAGYFTRFFVRQTGRTPTAWRAAAAQG